MLFSMLKTRVLLEKMFRTSRVPSTLSNLEGWEFRLTIPSYTQSIYPRMGGGMMFPHCDVRAQLPPAVFFGLILQKMFHIF